MSKLPEERGAARMVRVSDCKHLVATVFRSSIIIEKSEVFVGQRHLDVSILYGIYMLNVCR